MPDLDPAEVVEDAMVWAADRADPVILAALARWRDATGGGEKENA